MKLFLAVLLITSVACEKDKANDTDETKDTIVKVVDIEKSAFTITDI